MSINSIKALAELVGEPEIIPFLGGCRKHDLAEVEDLLHSLVVGLGHPSPAYRARVRAGLLNSIWDRVYEFNQADYLKGLILDRIEYRTRVTGLYDNNRELWILANLWDMSESGKDLDAECDALEDWDLPYLEEHYLGPVPSPDAVANTAGRAIYYVANNSMSGMVSTHEAVKYFGWEI